MLTWGGSEGDGARGWCGRGHGHKEQGARAHEATMREYGCTRYGGSHHDVYVRATPNDRTGAGAERTHGGHPARAASFKACHLCM